MKKIIYHNYFIRVENLKPGNYYFIETKTLTGYVLNNEKINFIIESNQKIALELTSKNYKIKGSIEITKLGEDKKPLAGAEFVIKNEAGEIVSKAKTDENGIVKFTELPYGKYSYQEVIAPDGYILDNNKYDFIIREDGEVIKVYNTNKKEKVTQTTITTNNPQTIPKTGGISGTIIIGVIALVGGKALLSDGKKR